MFLLVFGLHYIKSTMPADMSNPKEYQDIFHWAETQKNGAVPSFATRKNDLYKYMPGFNNSFESEAIPGTIPRGQNSPRCVRFGLYAEQLTASAFVAPRHSNKKAWLYRARPAVAHQGFVSSLLYQSIYFKLMMAVDRYARQ